MPPAPGLAVWRSVPKSDPWLSSVLREIIGLVAWVMPIYVVFHLFEAMTVSPRECCCFPQGILVLSSSIMDWSVEGPSGCS